LRWIVKRTDITRGSGRHIPHEMQSMHLANAR
jgi:hypothetical protein